MSALPATPLPGQPSIYGRLWDVAALILTNIIPALNPVDRVFVSPGIPAGEFGCDILAVQLVAVRAGLPGTPVGGPISAATVLSGEFDIHLWRELASGGTDDHGQPLTADQLNLVSALIYQDAWGLLQLVVGDTVDWEFLGIGTVVAILSLTGYGPEGGMVGHTLKLEVGLA